MWQRKRLGTNFGVVSANPSWVRCNSNALVRRLFLLFRQEIVRQPILIGLVLAAAIDNLRLVKRLAHGPIDMVTFIEKVIVSR